METVNRRNGFEIWHDILKFCRMNKGARKTHIIRGANLGSQHGDRHIADMVAMGLLEKQGTSYHVTEKGLEMLLSLKKVLEIAQVKVLDMPEKPDKGFSLTNILR